MLQKIYSSFDEAVADVPEGACVMFGGFAAPGTPRNLIAALLRRGTKGLIAISNRAGGGRGLSDDVMDIGRLIENRQISRVICSITAAPKRSMEVAFDRMYQAGEIEAELVPQGTLAERIRAGGAGLGPFYLRTGTGTELVEGKETRTFANREYVLEHPLTADYAFVRAWRADRMGNLQYRLAQRNFNPIMAQAARITIAEVENDILEPGSIDPDQVHTPGVYVDRIVRIPPAPDGIWDRAYRPPPGQ